LIIKTKFDIGDTIYYFNGTRGIPIVCGECGKNKGFKPAYEIKSGRVKQIHIIKYDPEEEQDYDILGLPDYAVTVGSEIIDYVSEEFSFSSHKEATEAAEERYKDLK